MKYKTLNPVRHDGKLYQTGEALEVDDTAADALLACGAVAPLAEAEDDETEQEESSVESEPEVKPAKKQKGKAK